MNRAAGPGIMRTEYPRPLEPIPHVDRIFKGSNQLDRAAITANCKDLLWLK